MDHRATLINALKTKRWALMDIEYIQTRKTHQCIRKMFILTGDGEYDMEAEFDPCVRYRSLPDKYQRAFRHCKANIHKLSYRPLQSSGPCIESLGAIREFVEDQNVEVVLYKGGTIEKDVCEAMGVESLNIEVLDELRKVHSHDPATEVNLYCDQLYNISLNS